MGIMDTIGNIGKDVAPFLGPIGGVASTLIDAAQQRSNNALQVNLANTAYQRSRADMEKAGMNPALAYQQGGAQTPQTAPVMQNTGQKFATALQSYNDIATGVADRALKREQTNAAATQANLNATNVGVLTPQAIYGNSGAGQRAYFDATLAGYNKAKQEAENYPEQYKANIEQLRAQTSNLDAQAGTATSQANLNRSLETLNEQQFTNDWFRKNIQPYANSTAATINAFSGAAKFIPAIRYMR